MRKHVDLFGQISLFSGVGCTELGLKLVLPIRTVAYCESNPYCQRVLQARMADGLLDDAPIWDDVRTFPAEQFAGGVDIISGGFPCQDISSAGKGAGLLAGGRSGLWWQMANIIRRVGPRLVLLENVPTLTVRGIEHLLGWLAQAGYDAVWTCNTASDVGAPMLGKRIWILASGKSQPERAGFCPDEPERQRRRRFDYCSGPELGEAASIGMEGHGAEGEQEPDSSAGEIVSGCSGGRTLWPAGQGREQFDWEPMRTIEPGLGRSADGSAHRVDRVEAIGNGIVPQQLAAALIELLGALPTGVRGRDRRGG